MAAIRHLPLTVALLATFGADPVSLAQSSDTTDPTVDAIERQLELGRHTRLLARIADGDARLTAFTTDGCSGGLSASWAGFAAEFPAFAERHGDEPPWQSCCVEHDRRYHAGGARSRSAADSFEQRKAADLALVACVVATGAERSADLRALYPLSEAQVAGLYQSIAELVYRAVRLGGLPCTTEPWRWGYGWPPCL
jgi:hypothetical protein